MLWMIGRFVGLDASLTEGVAGRAAELGFPPLAGATAADGELACIARDGDDDGGNAAWLTGGPTRSGLASLADDRPCLVMPGPGPLGASFVLPGAVPPPGSVVLSGSFNPLHGGHEALLAAASAAARREDAALAGVDPASLPLPSRVLELSATNADKGSLDPAALAARAELCAGPLPDAELAGLGLAGHPDSLRELYPADATGSSGELLPLLVTTLPFFPDKAERLGRGSWLVVGVDTAVRLCDDKYFGGAPSGVTRALARIEASGCRVLVAGRPADAKAGEGRFVTLDGESRRWEAPENDAGWSVADRAAVLVLRRSRPPRCLRCAPIGPVRCPQPATAVPSVTRSRRASRPLSRRRHRFCARGLRCAAYRRQRAVCRGE